MSSQPTTWLVADDVGNRHSAASFLATHVSSRARLASLRSAIRSIRNQSVWPNLHISWSSTAKLEAATQAVLKEEATGPAVRGCYHHKRRRSQFEHYRFLARRVARDLANDEVVWVLFSDDDDIWHPSRLDFYCAVVSNIAAAERATSQAVVCPWFLQRTPGYETSKPIESVDEAEAELRAGRAAVEDLTDQEDAYEHWSAFVRLSRVLDFFEMAPDGLVTSLFCDVAFARFFGKGHDKDVTTQMCKYMRDAGFPWLYCYNVSPNLDVKALMVKNTPSTASRRVGEGEEEEEDDDERSHAGSGPAQLTDADEAAARAALPEMATQFAAARGRVASHTVETLADKIARDRRTLTVLAASRLWIASTVTIRDKPGGSAVSPEARARTLSHMTFEDLFAMYRKHFKKADVEIALDLFVMDVCLENAMREILTTLGFVDADGIADAFEAQLAGLKDEACQKTLGFNVTSAVERLRAKRAARAAAAVSSTTVDIDSDGVVAAFHRRFTVHRPALAPVMRHDALATARACSASTAVLRTRPRRPAPEDR